MGKFSDLLYDIKVKITTPSNNDVLTYVSADSQWENVPLASGLTNPMTTAADIIVGNTGGTPARLGKGADGQVLTVDPTTHLLVWATSSSGFANPMTTAADLIVGGTGGTPARLATGSDSQVLTIDPTTHLLVWATSSSGFADPLTTKGDVIVHGSSTTRLPVGLDTQVLTADSAQTLGVKWASASVVSINAQTASYTLVLGDLGYVIEMSVAFGNTLTVPPNSSVAFPTGTILEVFQLGAGQCTITPGSGVTLRSDGAKTKTAAQYASVSLRKRDTDEWVLAGDLA